MANITQGDFKFLKRKIYDDKTYHERNFLARINPDVIDRYYESDPNASWKNADVNATERMTLNKLYPATVTFLSQITPKNPKFVCTARDESKELDAKITEGAVNYYYGEMKGPKKTALAIASAWFYGYGITKQGWRVQVGTDPAQKTDRDNSEQSIVGKIAGIFTGSPKVEEKDGNEYIASEGPFMDYVSCKNIYFDKDKSIFDSKFFTQHLVRSLQEVKESGIYQLDDDFYSRFKRGKDPRESILDLYEQWNWQKDGMYVFTMCEGYDKPLRYDKIPYASEGFPFKILIFNLQPDEIYPVSAMKIAQRQQRMLDYIVTLQKEAIEKYRDLTVFDSNAFDDRDRKRIEKNEIGTNVFTKNGVPPAGAATHVGGANIPQDLFAIENLMDTNIREIFSVVGAVGGASSYDTATQEKIGQMGNQIRTMGFATNVNDFLLEQGLKLKQDLKQFGTMEGMVKVTGLNLKDPATGQAIQEKWVEYGTLNSPQLLKDIIPQDLDMTVDVTEGLRQDKSVVRKQMMEYVGTVVMPLMPLLQQEGTKFNATAFAKKVAENFETLGSVEQFFDKLPPVPPVVPGTVPTTGQPPIPSENVDEGTTPESIIGGINRSAGGI